MCISLGIAGIQNSVYSGLNDTLVNDESSLLEGLASNEVSTIPNADTSTSSANSSSEDGPNKSSDAPSDDAVLETETPSPSNPTGDGSDEKLSVEDVGKPNIRTTTLGSGSNKLQIRHISQEMILHNPMKATADSGKYRQFDLEIRCDSGEAALSGGFWLRTSTTKVMSSRTAGEVYYLTMEAGPGDHQTEINVNCLNPLS